MTQPPNGFDPNDPFGAWRAWRDASLDAWAKSMTSMVNTESFSQAIGAQLDAMLAVNGPMQSMVQQSMERYLAQANLPSRTEMVSLAGRLTQIELRLDDMQAQLDELVQLARRPAQAVAPERIDQLSAQLAAVAAALNSSQPTAAAAAPATPRRGRKPAPAAE